MPQLIEAPTRIQAHGQPSKTIEEFIGRMNSKTESVSVARMISPSGWSEPGQTPDFDEFTVVLRGELQVETREGVHRIAAGQAIAVHRGEWARYSTPSPQGAEYISVCVCPPFPQPQFTAILMNWPNKAMKLAASAWFVPWKLDLGSDWWRLLRRPLRARRNRSQLPHFGSRLPKNDAKPTVVWRALAKQLKDYAAFLDALRNGKLDDRLKLSTLSPISVRLAVARYQASRFLSCELRTKFYVKPLWNLKELIT